MFRYFENIDTSIRYRHIEWYRIGHLFVYFIRHIVTPYFVLEGPFYIPGY